MALHQFGQQQKIIFSIEKSILGWKSTTGRAAFQSDFKFYAGVTSNFFALDATNVYATLQNVQLLTDGIIRSEGVSKWAFFI